MIIKIKLFATLRQFHEKEMHREIEPGATPANILEHLGIPHSHVSIILINGRHGKLDSTLADGDTLALFPPVGGG